MKRGLVMEGGAMRGLFTCGVTDVMMEHGITFDGAAGVSAGATFGCNYKSGQIGRAYRYNRKYCGDRRYGSWFSVLRSGDMYDARFCYEDIPNVLDPFDTETYSRSPMEFYYVVTDMETGRPVYHKSRDGGPGDLLWMRASASMPVVSRPVVIKGRSFSDGGTADPIPLRFMQRRGYDRNVVILTQPEGFVKEQMKLFPLVKLILRRYPGLVDALERRPRVYNRTLHYIAREEQSGRVFVVRPPQALNISSTEKKAQEIDRVYEIGRQTGLALVEDMKKFLEED